MCVLSYNQYGAFMISELLLEKRIEDLKKYLEETHSFDISQEIESLEQDQIVEILELLDDEKKAEVLSYFKAEQAADIIEEMPLNEQVEILEDLEPDDAIDIINEYENEEAADEVIKALVSDPDIGDLREYGNDEIGSRMTNEFISVDLEMDVKQATKKVIALAGNVENISTIFVVNSDRVFEGVISLRKLLKTKSPAYVKDIIEDHPFVYDNDSITSTIHTIDDTRIRLLPVVDKEMKLKGMITLDDAMDAYQKEVADDLAQLTAVRKASKSNDSLFIKAGHRTIPLIVLLILELPLMFITRQFEAVLNTVAILMLFSPLILDLAGDCASQTLCVTLRLLNHDSKELVESSTKEFFTGVVLSSILSVFVFLITALVTYIRQLNPEPGQTIINIYHLGLSVGTSMLVAVIVATMIGMGIPIFAKKIKLDPAVVSGPVITTIVDIFSLLVYFTMATLLLL